MTADFHLSPQTIDALAEVISGGSANDPTPSVGRYRTGPQLEKFMRACNVDFRVGQQSRLPALANCLIAINNGPDAANLLTQIGCFAVYFNSLPVQYPALARDMLNIL